MPSTPSLQYKARLGSLVLLALVALIIVGAVTGCGGGQAAVTRLSASSRCADWSGATESARAQYIRKAEPSISGSPPIVNAISEYVRSTCGPPVNLVLNQLAMNHALVHVTGLRPGEAPPVPTSSSIDEGVLGAADADWNAAHTMDRQYDEGVAYDLTEGLSNGATDRFSSVIHSNGHVTSFYLAFPSETSINQAVQMTMSVLPKDTMHGPVVTQAECATIRLESATLRAELGSPYAVAFFGEGTSYNAAAVTGVEIMAGESHTSC
jgi:hypothetical protein